MNSKKFGDLQESYLEIYEAEGSYGRTPKAREKMGSLANRRRSTPAKELNLTTGKTKTDSVTDAERHFYRMGNPDAGNRGRRSPRPSGDTDRQGMTQAVRDTARGRAEYGHTGYDPDYDGPASGPGGKPKGKKLERQRKSGVSAESFDLYDLILSHLLDEGYVETEEAAEAIMVNMSEEWRDSILEAYTEVYSEGYKERPVEKMKDKAMKIVDNPNYKGETGDVWRYNQLLKYATKSKRSRESSQKKSQKNIDKSYEIEDRMEEYDLYDIILSHLLDEGYVETEEAAEAIMVNMSEEWRDSILEAYKSPPVNKMKRQAAKKKLKALGYQMKSAWQGEEGRKKSMDKSDKLETQADRIEKEIEYTRNLQDVEDLSRHRKISDDRKKSGKIIGSQRKIKNQINK